MEDAIKARGLERKIEYHCMHVPWIKFKPGSWQEFERYIRKIDDLESDYFDGSIGYEIFF